MTRLRPYCGKADRAKIRAIRFWTNFRAEGLRFPSPNRFDRASGGLRLRRRHAIRRRQIGKSKGGLCRRKKGRRKADLNYVNKSYNAKPEQLELPVPFVSSILASFGRCCRLKMTRGLLLSETFSA
jgi:hypothetical protein